MPRLRRQPGFADLSGGKALAALALLAVAGAPAAAAPKPRGGDEDPNREVCKSRPVIGSRVARVRECHTAQQWEELRWMEREGLMRKQVNGDPGCSEAVNCNIRAGAKDSPI